jgi:hypothetical protein
MHIYFKSINEIKSYYIFNFNRFQIGLNNKLFRRTALTGYIIL